ncbi:hypothetical protein NAI52_11065, partial [Francisella tularensis subsp. holarctica]|nr:hypothetical protein [Francisella tularensis subsp. holarctica]
MMAFLLDIIKFLQISFSTNIFRINYNSWIVNVAYIKDYDILAKNPKKVETIENKSPTQIVNEINQNTAEINKL